ncbi:MAG: AbrB/MazE/SpoVT family DNA-binding domain-containing protein [Alistipes sp.]|nr:AbrB/MazE/SpoVT family DNA-binding domain-containing protein [Rikenellaceae bacterium]MBO4992878.1 AbrB/MazE/SpoVT family DNA-binding domain-containing protein [Alistipes sp.]MBO5398706.1 AbrB/MazE/SpoVT family DNA-binding domain-containing protein [Alistipes sp.]MBP3473757.1 AbrB/MazE/SpoVT family DNA-binding domain-containing protein [Alistipes sp.]MBQ1253153.1 AbrB/MazE/SpoVT family DNA-binding domain-containing protein [Alistipes sp.]
MQEKDGKYIFGVLKISEKGQIVIPKEARKIYNLQPGDALILMGDKNGMAMVKTEIFHDLVDQVMEGLNK